MHPNVDESPLHHGIFRPGLVVFDTIYTPEQTLLIKEARDRGCHVITGVELFIRQAALQFEYFTGRQAPVDLVPQGRPQGRCRRSPSAKRKDET